MKKSVEIILEEAKKIAERAEEKAGRWNGEDTVGEEQAHINSEIDDMALEIIECCKEIQKLLSEDEDDGENTKPVQLDHADIYGDFTGASEDNGEGR